MTSSNRNKNGPVVRERRLRAAREETEREAVLVLGMHRSGTSALTRVISLLGADLPAHLMPPKEGNNEVGFWESQEAYRLNDAILDSAGSSWDDWCRLNPGWFRSRKAKTFRKQARELLETEFAGSPLFVFKDPRICRLLPFWLNVLEDCGSQVRFVIALRNPLEIAASLKKRDGFSPAKSHVLWLRHVLDAERDSRGWPRAFVSYDALLDDWRSTMRGLGEHLEMEWPRWSAVSEVEIDRFLSEAHRHHAIDDAKLLASPEIGAWVKGALGAFRKLLANAGDASALKQLDVVHGELDRASDVLGAVVRAEQVARQDAQELAAGRMSEVTDAQEKLADYGRQLEQRAREIEQRDKALESSKHDLEQGRQQLEKGKRQIDSVQQQIVERDRKIDELKQTVASVESRASATQQAADRHAEEAQALEQRVSVQTAELELLGQQMEERERLLQSTLDELGESQANYDALKSELEQREVRITEVSAVIEARDAEIQELRAAVSAHNDIVQSLEQQARNKDGKIQELQERIAERTARIDEAARVVAERDGQLKAMSERLSKQEQQLAALGGALKAGESGLSEQKRLNGQVADERNQALRRLGRIYSDPLRNVTPLLRGVRRLLPVGLRPAVAMPGKRCCGVDLDHGQRRRIHRQAKTLAATGVFDADWYVEQYPDVVLNGANPILHWLVVGWREGRNPNPVFDTAWYLDKNPDVAEAGTNPLLHYLKFGVTEGRNPGPDFDGEWYLRTYPDVAEAGMNPMRHYLRFGREEGRLGHPPNVARSSSSAADSSPSNANQVVVGKAGETDVSTPKQDVRPGAGMAAVTAAGLSENTRTGMAGVLRDRSAEDDSLLERIYRYKDIRAKRGKARVVVYTANIGNYDALVQHRNICDDWDYVCITDRAIPGIYCWDFRYVDYINADPVRTARYYKTHPHILFPEYEYSIWVDSNIDVVGDHLKNAVERLINDHSRVASVPHPHWDCIYTDAEKCIEFRKDSEDTIRDQIRFLEREKYPREQGLIETNVMFRRHLDRNVIEAMNEWWSVICRYSRRDQLSFNFVLHKHGVNCDSVFEDQARSTRNHPDYRYFLHKGDSNHHYSHYTPPYFNRDLPALSNGPFLYDRDFSVPFDHATKQGPSVDVIVPVYNALDDVKKCLESVQKTLGPNQYLSIADDCSDEETAAWLKEFSRRSSSIRLTRRDRNIGFTANINAAVKDSDADFVVLLNSDTIVAKGWIEKLLLCAYSADEIGLVGPLSNAASWQSIPDIEGKDGQLAINAVPPGMTVEDVNVFLQEISLHPQYPRVHLLNGFCLGVKRVVFETVGLFDEKAFPAGYGEEDDFCMRAHEAGFSLAVATHTYVFHAKSKSFGSVRRKEILEKSWETLKSRYGVRYLQNAIASSKRHPGLANLRSRMREMRDDAFSRELDPATLRAGNDHGWSSIEVPNLLAGYDAPQVNPDYEASRPYRGDSDVSLIAFYLPQFYPFKKNDEVWGKGFTEWTNVTRAMPLFKGHQQPKLPDALGFYDTRLKETLVGQVELARQHGIKGFCFHHYFFKDQPIMRVPLNLFLDNPDIDFPFCLHWANEPWTTTWTYTYREKSSDTVIYDQEHSEANDLAFIRDAHRALVDPRYIKVDGRPLLMIYRPGLFPDIKATLSRWRKYCRDNGIGDLHMVMVQTNAEGEQDPRDLGFDAAVEFPPHLIEPKYLHREMQFFYPQFDGAVIDYQSVVASSLAKPKTDYIRYRGLFPRWDNTPRKIHGTSIFVNETPDRYQQWLEGLIKDSRDSLPEGHRLIFVNAWNEWAEGAFLEPDRRYGYAYLNAGARALENTSPARERVRLEPDDRIAIQIHAFHVDVFQHIFEKLSQGFAYPADLLISTSTEEDKQHIADITSAYREGEVIIRVFQNQGRDIAPFVVGFADLLPAYTYAVHLHTKKSEHGAEFSGWLDYLLDELVGDPVKAGNMLEQITAPDVGIVFPHHYWRVKDRIRWGANLERTNELLDGTGIVLTESDAPVFPSGSMFYFRPACLMKLFAKGLEFQDFAVEDGQVDGTLAHAIERSFCYFAQSAGYRSIMISSAKPAE